MTSRPWSGLLLALAVASASARAETGPGDVQAGAKAFVPCSACHSVAAGGAALIGPNLHGVVGREVGSSPGFDYSPELKAVGGTWTPEQLDRFLTSPSGFAPGTRMGYVGVADPVERRALIAYLSGLRAESGAAVAAQARDFGPDWPAGPGQAETGELCNSCHSLAIVKQQRLSRETWDKLLTWMVDKQGMAAQSPERRALMLEYLVQNFGQP
jgi:cytochrome c